jgi:hypothetical protein
MQGLAPPLRTQGRIRPLRRNFSESSSNSFLLPLCLGSPGTRKHLLRNRSISSARPIGIRHRGRTLTSMAANGVAAEEYHQKAIAAVRCVPLIVIPYADCGLPMCSLNALICLSKTPLLMENGLRRRSYLTSTVRTESYVTQKHSITCTRAVHRHGSWQGVQL